jgi:hypothetical protein
VLTISGESHDAPNSDQTLRSYYSKKQRGLPPVTPIASIRNDILNHLFDDVWSEVCALFLTFSVFF